MKWHEWHKWDDTANNKIGSYDSWRHSRGTYLFPLGLRMVMVRHFPCVEWGCCIRNGYLGTVANHAKKYCYLWTFVAKFILAIWFLIPCSANQVKVQCLSIMCVFQLHPTGWHPLLSLRLVTICSRKRIAKWQEGLFPHRLFPDLSLLSANATTDLIACLQLHAHCCCMAAATAAAAHSRPKEEAVPLLLLLLPVYSASFLSSGRVAK
jgi:hypothetical protein